MATTHEQQCSFGQAACSGLYGVWSQPQSKNDSLSPYRASCWWYGGSLSGGGNVSGPKLIGSICAPRSANGEASDHPEGGVLCSRTSSNVLTTTSPLLECIKMGVDNYTMNISHHVRGRAYTSNDEPFRILVAPAYTYHRGCTAPRGPSKQQ